MRRTLIKDGVVVNVIVLDDGVSYAPPAGHILGPEGGEIGDLWDGESYIKSPEPEPEPEPPTVQELLDYLGRKRVEVEEGGIVLNGTPIATDRSYSQVKITAAYVKAMADPDFTVTNWKIAPGVFLPAIDAATIIAMGDAVTAHIQACFDKEAELAAEILADPPTITTYEQIDEADWPSNS